jgi:hypothetical protein
MSRLLLSFSSLAMALVLVACGKKEADEGNQKNAVSVVLVVPKTNDSNAWKQYLQSVVTKPEYQEVVTDRIIPYFLPSNSEVADNDPKNPEISSPYSRQMEVVKPAIERTVTKGQLLVFGSPDSNTMAKFVVEAFTGATPTAVKGSSVLFIGKSEDAERVKAVVEAAGGSFLFEEVQ